MIWPREGSNYPSRSCNGLHGPKEPKFKNKNKELMAVDMMVVVQCLIVSGLKSADIEEELMPVDVVVAVQCVTVYPASSRWALGSEELMAVGWVVAVQYLTVNICSSMRDVSRN